MVIVVDENRIETILQRLCSVGLSRSLGGALFGLPKSFVYNLQSSSNTECTCEGLKDCRVEERLELVDKAEALLQAGYPLDMVCQIARIPASKLLYFLDEMAE